MQAQPHHDTAALIDYGGAYDHLADDDTPDVAAPAVDDGEPDGRADEYVDTSAHYHRTDSGHLLYHCSHVDPCPALADHVGDRDRDRDLRGAVADFLDAWDRSGPNFYANRAAGLRPLRRLVAGDGL